MGTYTYLFTAPKTTITIEGKSIKLATYRFGFKPYWRPEDNPRIWGMWAGAAQKLFERRTTDYAVTTLEEGAAVYTDLYTGAWDDCDASPGRKIGTLHKVGSKWTLDFNVVPVVAEPALAP